MDSLGMLDLVGFLENEFRVAISDDDLLPENFRRPSTIAASYRPKWNSHSHLRREWADELLTAPYPKRCSANRFPDKEAAIRLYQ